MNGSVVSIPMPLAIDSTLAHDEEIICRNATIAINSRGEISWFDNDKVLAIITKENEEE